MPISGSESRDSTVNSLRVTGFFAIPSMRLYAVRQLSEKQSPAMYLLEKVEMGVRDSRPAEPLR